MAECPECGREMTTGASCTVEALHQHGRRYELARFRPQADDGPAARRCGDCGVAAGGLHHLGCDLQSCQVCGDQLLSCGCLFDEDGDIEVDDDADGNAYDEATGGLGNDW